MAFEEKYQKNNLEYIVAMVWRKLSTSILAYPEFIFLGKIILGLFTATLLFYLFNKYFGLF